MALSVCGIWNSRERGSRLDAGHIIRDSLISLLFQSLSAESGWGQSWTPNHLNPRRRSSVASANASIKSSGPSQESADTSWLRPARRICPSFGGPRVRIHFPRLARDFSFLYRKAGSCRSVWPRPGGMVGRDAQGTSTSRQLLEISLSGSIPVPQCRLGALQPGCTGAPREIGLAM